MLPVLSAIGSKLVSREPDPDGIFDAQPGAVVFLALQPQVGLNVERFYADFLSFFGGHGQSGLIVMTQQILSSQCGETATPAAYEARTFSRSPGMTHAG